MSKSQYWILDDKLHLYQVNIFLEKPFSCVLKMNFTLVFADFPFSEEMFVEPINIGEEWQGFDQKFRKTVETKRQEALKANKLNVDLDKAIKFEKCN